MYTYDIDPQAMFEDRAQQFEKFGIPCDDIARVRAAVTDTWADAPGGWVYEWSKLAQDYADSGDHATAATACGFAKFPCLAARPECRRWTGSSSSTSWPPTTFPCISNAA